MASGLGITLGIVAGAAAIGLTAGLAAPAVGLAGATTLGSGAVLGIGGLGLSASTALATGVVAFGAGMALTQSPLQPEPISQVARQLATTSDPETPWEWVYGTVVKGGLLAWTGIGGGDDQYIGADIVLACHPCEALLEIQVGDWTFPIVTHVDGDTNYNGLGLILNTGQTVDPDVFPADWYVPVKGGANGDSAWWRNPQDDKNTPDRPHIGLKIYYGTQTVTDSHMATRFGTAYSGVDRKFIGHTVVHIILRAHTELGTMGGLPEIKFRLQGKNDIQDHTGGNADYRNNCALVFADYCREHFGIPVTDIVGINAGQTLQGVAAECDDTTWAGSGSAPRYTFDGVIRDDMQPTEALDLITQHMAGGYSERGDQIAIFTGTVKSTWSGSPFTVDDLAGDEPILVSPPDQDSWANTIVPHFVVQRPLDEDGKRVLHGAMEPAKVDVTASAYVTEDDGVVFRQDAKFPACTLGRRAKWLSWIVLKQMRLGASATFRLKKRASVLERGDVFSVNFPDFFPNGTKWQVTGKRMLLGPDTFAVELDAVRYDDDIYTPGTTPTEDAIGVVPRNRSSILPLITGLTAAVVEDSAEINANGKIIVSAVVSWNLVSSILVRNAGDIRIQRRVKAGPGAIRGFTAAGDDIQTIIPGWRQDRTYEIRARAEGTPSAGRTDKPVGRWSAWVDFTPDSGSEDLPGPPGTGITGQNKIADGNFELGPNAGTWLLNDAGATATGSATIATTAGKYGPHELRIDITAASIGNEYRVRHNIYHPVSAGEWHRYMVAARKRTGPSFEARLNALFYDTALSTITTKVPIQETVTSGAYQESRFVGRSQVPGDNQVVWARPQLHHEALSSGAQDSGWDGVAMHDLTVMRGVRQTTQVDTSDTTNWVNLATLTGFADSATTEVSIYFDGETDITVRATVSASVARGATNVTSRTRAVARLRLEEVGVGTTSIVTQIQIARLTVADGVELAGAGASEVDTRILETTLQPTAGHYKLHLEGRMQGDATNGTAQFFDRWFRVVKD